ncbi:MAG TPA: hypothetical protein PLY68_05235 [Myxococcota bacterium]|nr:hypothetical protein [Myxococcota bacterium]
MTLRCRSFMCTSARIFSGMLFASVVGISVVLGGGCGLSDGQDDGPGTDVITERPVCTGTWGGGTVTGPGAAMLSVTEGKVPPCANLSSGPSLSAVSVLPAGFPLDEARENVITEGGAAVAVDAGSVGFNVDAEGALLVTLGYEPIKLPIGAIENSTNTFVRVWEPGRDVAHDVQGRVDVDQFTVTVRLLGLAPDSTMAVVHRPGRVAVTTSDPAFAAMPVNRAATPFGAWAGRDWCVIHDYDSAELREAVRQAQGLTEDPSPATIAATVRTRVAQAGRDAQMMFEGLGLRAPYLYVADDPEGPCGDVLGATPRYELHIIDNKGSNYTFEDPDEATGPDDRHYGRIYVMSSRIGNDASHRLGTVRSTVAHEMTHAIQMGYEILASSAFGLAEGTSTVAGMYFDKGGITVRSMDGRETFRLSEFLMVEGGAHSYSNQDFFAFVARRYGGGTLAFMPVLFQAVRDAISSAMSGFSTQAEMDAVRRVPGTFTMHRGIDAAIRTAWPGIGLSEVYRDFVIERALLHGSESVFGRNSETTQGFASDLFYQGFGSPLDLVEVSASMSQCEMSTTQVGFNQICPFSSRAIRIRASDVPEPARNGDLEVTLEGAEIGKIWAWGWRNGQLQTIEGPTVFEDFGSVQDEEIVLLVAHSAIADECQKGVKVLIWLACDDQKPTGEDPMECGSQSGVMACNYVPSTYYWRRACEEYTGSHWYEDPSQLDSMCLMTNDADWCATTGCARDHILGRCGMSFGENSDVVFYYYDTVDYSGQGFDPQADCAENNGTWY